MATKRASIKETLNKEFEYRDIPMKDEVEQAHNEPIEDPLVIFSIRLPQSQKKALQRLFKQEMGLDMSSGVRMVLTKYLRNN